MKLFSYYLANSVLLFLHIISYAGANRSSAGINGKTYTHDLVALGEIKHQAEVRTRRRSKASHKGDFHVQNEPWNGCRNESTFLGCKSALL